MKLENWIIVDGNGNVGKNGELKLVSDSKTKESYNECIFRTHVYFKEGTIKFKAKFSSEESAVVVCLGGENRLIIGCTTVDNAFVIRVGNKILCQSSSLSSFKLDAEIDFEIDIKGSNIILKVNKVELCKANYDFQNDQIGFVLKGKDEIIVKNIEVLATPLTAFVVMQFSDEYNELYKEIIKPVCEKYNISCVRADELYYSTPILKDIVDSIINSSLVIAEITPDNPNVFYEIGYAHAINKPTILLCNHTRERLPFDISGFRTIFYENSIAGKRKAEDNFSNYITNIFSNSNYIK